MTKAAADLAELRRIAASFGLDRLTDEHLLQLRASLDANAKLVRQLPDTLHWTEEPAHVFRLVPPRGAGS